MATDILIRWIAKRVGHNKNAIIVINGETGSGKTYTAIKLAIDAAEYLGSNFTINTNMDFNFPNLLRKTMLPENTKPGTPFVFEEVGAVGSGSAAREWQSKANRFFHSFMQTTRHRQQILIFTCPSFSDLELAARKLCHLQVQTAGINFAAKLAHIKPYIVQINSRSGKFYFKHIRVVVNGLRTAVPIIKVPHIPKDVAKEYEDIKTIYTTKLNKQILDESDEKKKKQHPGKIFDAIRYEQLRQTGLNDTDCARIMGITTRTIRNNRKSIS